MPKQPVNVLISDGGMGDLLCSLVALDYNIRHYPNAIFYVWLPDYMVDFAKHVVTPGSIIRSYSKGKSKYNESFPGVTTAWGGRSFHTPMRTHPVDYAFHVITDKHIYDLNEKNYLKIRPEEIKIDKFKLPEKYVVIASASVVPVKEMPAETANVIINYVLEKGYVPVFLGKNHATTGYKDIALRAKTLEIDLSKGINLVNRTDLLESAKIISNAKAMIGMDGGLVHLAGFTDTEIVAGFTLVDPGHIAPIRNGSQNYKFHAVVPDEDIPNRFYQTMANFNFDEDMRWFDGWERVVASMTPDKFIRELEKIL